MATTTSMFPSPALRAAVEAALDNALANGYHGFILHADETEVLDDLLEFDAALAGADRDAVAEVIGDWRRMQEAGL